MKNFKIFEKAYQDENIVKDYDAKRFSSKAGKLYNQLQIKYVLKFLKPVKSRKILDAGAGTGRFSIALKALGGDVHAMDTSPLMLEQISAKMSGIKLYKGSVLNIKFKENMFDGINCFLVLRHMNDDEVTTAFNEFFRVMKPGGILTFDCPSKNIYAISGMIRSLFGKKRENKTGIDRGFDYEWIQKTLGSYGFSIENIKYIYKFNVPILDKLLNIFDISRLWKKFEERYNFGTTAIIMARCRKD